MKKNFKDQKNTMYYGAVLMVQAVFYLLTPFITSFMGRSINVFERSMKVSVIYFLIFSGGFIGIKILSGFVKVQARMLTDKAVQTKREEYLENLVGISWDQYTKLGEGELLYQIFELIDIKCNNTFKIWSLAVEIIVTLLAVTVNVIFISPIFLLVLFLFLPVCVWWSLRAADGCLGTHEKKVQAQTDYHNVLTENLINIYSIHLNGDGDFFQRRFIEKCSDNIAAEKEHQRAILRYQISDRVCRLVSEIAIFLLTCVLIWKGKLMVGWLMVLLEYGNVFFQQLSQLNYMKDLYQEIKVIDNNLEKVKVCRKISSGNETEIKRAVSEQPILEIKNAVVSYDGSHQQNAYNFSAKTGEKILLTGKSGSGKTTFFRSLVRFLDIESGSILFCGKESKNLDIQILRENIAYMPQKTYLFEGTIFENILWGEGKADKKQLMKLIEASNLTHLLYESDGSLKKISGFGNRVSGGERQRIGILRTLMCNSELYIFDEPFSNLDEQMKKIMIELILKVCKDKTVIIISHDRCIQEYMGEVRNIYEISKVE